jgi:chromosome segregation ATPase
MTTPTDAKKIVDAAHEARDALNAARQRAIELLNPDPVEVLADVIADRDAAIAERDKHSERRNAMSADLDAIHGMVGRPELPIVEAVCAMADQVKALRADLDALRKEHVQATETIEHLRERRRELKDEVDRLTTSLSTAETDAETQRTAADDLRNALDRVAVAAGVGTDSTASIVADLVVDAIRRLSSDRDQMRVAREDAAEDLERLNAILSSAGIDTTGPAADVADRVAAALLRPALPADLRAYLEARRDRLVDVSGLSAASEIAALTGWIASPTAEVKP